MGISVPKDVSQAFRWYQKAAQQGDSRAQNNLAGLYEEGAAVPKDFEEAMKWYKLAAEQGNGNSYVNLAQLYAGARGFKPDYGQAYFWGLVAEDTPWPVMKRPERPLLEFLRRRLSPEQIAETEAQAESWKKNHTLKTTIGDFRATWSLLVLPEGSAE